MLKENQKGFHVLETILIIFMLAVISIIGYYVFTSNTSSNDEIDNQQKTSIENTTQDTNFEKPTCDTKVNVTKINHSTIGSAKPAIFKTDAGEIYITVHSFNTGGTLDPPAGEGVSKVYIGDSSELPVYDEQKSSVNNSLFSAIIKEDKYAKFNLDSGEYWIWVTNGWDIEIANCGGETQLVSESQRSEL